MERLQKVIANSGYCSRRKAEEEIKKGHVTVNGRVVMELGTKVDTQDVVEINGTVIKTPARCVTAEWAAPTNAEFIRLHGVASFPPEKLSLIIDARHIKHYTCDFRRHS